MHNVDSVHIIVTYGERKVESSPQVLVIVGHPRVRSFNSALAHEYASGVRDSGRSVEVVQLSELTFDVSADPTLICELEPDLQRMQRTIASAEHIVFFAPGWWTTFPALLKGFIDRTLTPGFAFQYESGKPLPKKLLKGKTARIVLTMDGPVWYYRFVNRAPGLNALNRGTLWLCGIKVIGNTLFSVRAQSDTDEAEAHREGLLKRCYAIGRKDARRLKSFANDPHQPFGSMPIGESPDSAPEQEHERLRIALRG